MKIYDRVNEVLTKYFAYGNYIAERQANKYYIYRKVNRQHVYLATTCLISAQNKLNILLIDYNLKLDLAYENVKDYGFIAIGFKLMPIK